MDDKIRAELNALFDQDQRRRDDLKRATEDRAAKQAANTALFDKLCQDVIEPAMQAFVALAADHGWTAKVSRHLKDATFHLPSISFAIENSDRGYTKSIPTFSVHCHPEAGSASFHTELASMSGTTITEALEKVSAEMVQTQLMIFMRKLLSRV